MAGSTPRTDSTLGRFARLHLALDSSPFHRDKAVLVAEFLSGAPREDAAWALYLMCGGQLEDTIPVERLREWIVEEADLPPWLVTECVEHAGDLFDTLSLLSDLAKGHDGDEGTPVADGLRAWIESRLGPWLAMPPAEQRDRLRAWWKTLPLGELSLTHQLLTGRYHPIVTRRLIEEALARIAGLPREAVAARLTRATARGLRPLREPRIYDELVARENSGDLGQLDLFSGGLASSSPRL